MARCFPWGTGAALYDASPKYPPSGSQQLWLLVASVFDSVQTLQAWNAGHALAVTSVTGEQSQRYREELEQLIKARMKPGERALPELRSSPAVRP